LSRTKPQSTPKAQSLPYSEDAEKGLLGSLVVAPDEVAKLVQRLSREHFYNPAHRTIYELLLKAKGPERSDFYWLKEELKKIGKLEEVGGPEFLNELWTFVPTGANASYYIKIVREKYSRRRLILACDSLSRRCYDDQEKFEPLLEEAEHEINEIVHGSDGAEPAEKKVFLEFLTPAKLKSYEPPPGIVLVGDNHITRGSVFVIGGAPGVGKSRASVALAEAGATGFEWFNLTVHCLFRTLIIQNENGRYRLKMEFSDLDEATEEFIRITPPPPYGLCFDRYEFRDQLAAQIAEFDPAVVIIDPWNAASRDDKAKGYLETFEDVRRVIPASEMAPSIGILAHTRKPQLGERSSGRALLSLLAGSYVLGSIPRCVFITQSASDDVNDNRVVWTCCKNNDGDLGPRSAWERCNGLFTPVTDFDWKSFDNPDGEKREITAAIMAEVFGDAELTKKDAVAAIVERGFKQAAAYRALETNGRFKENLFTTKKGTLKWIT
jgi:DnaB-like helicase N terminal domain/AAA domain